MNLRALIFDVDGTIADTEEIRRNAFNQAFKEHQLDWTWNKSLYSRLLKVAGCKERLKAYINSLSIAPAERSALTERVQSIYDTETANFTRAVLAGQVPLRDGVLRLMEEARRAHVRLAIASASAHRNIDAVLRSNLGPAAVVRFSVIGAGNEVARKKPAPDIYNWVLRELDESPSACVAIEDSENGVRAAKAAALFTVATPSDWTCDEDFSAADLVLPSLGSESKPLSQRFAAIVGNTVLGIEDIERHLSSTLFIRS
jgi:beta-phosphoglucomutase-like phosphatase (HAD superfamily)